MGAFELFLLVAMTVAGYFAVGRPALPARAGPSPLALDEVAEHLALPAPSRGATKLVGQVHGFTLTVEGHSDAARIFLESDERIPKWLRIAPAARYRARADDERVTTGDRYFDSLFAVCGPKAEVAALMSSSTRETLTRLLGTEVEDGTIHFRTTGHDSRMLLIAIDRVVELARVFADSNGYELDRVHEGALGDSHPLVRRHLLALLLQRHRGEDRTVETLTRALEDPVARNAFLAARALDNEDGRNYLKRFVIIGERNEERVEAFEQLLAHEPWDELSPLLETAALASSREMARRATEWLLEHGTPVVFTRLLDRLTPSTAHSDLVIRAATLARGSELERSLLALLQRFYGDMSTAGTMAAAVTALEEIGTAMSMPWLESLASGADPAFSEPRRAAKKAISAIRTRARAHAGALALVDEGDTAGALSVASAGTGAMSLTESDDLS